MDLFIQLRDHHIEILLESFSLSLLLGFDVCEDSRELSNLLLSILNSVFVLFLQLGVAVVAKYTVELSIEVNLITLGLEHLVNPVEILDLQNEIRHIIDGAL